MDGGSQMLYKNAVTGNFAEFGIAQGGDWIEATQEEIDAYEFTRQKSAKLKALLSGLDSFCCAGFTYKGNTFCLSDRSLSNILVKDECSAGMTDRYKYYDIGKAQVDFTDAVGFSAFKEAMLEEKDRVMRLYNSLHKQIDDCANQASLNAVTINFAAA
jgi:hypothetical protein